MRFPLDVTPKRPLLQGVVSVRLEDGTALPLDGVVLDTGATTALTGPESALPPALLKTASRTKLHGMGEQFFRVKRVEGVLLLDAWELPERIEILVHPQFRTWLLGMEVLHRFDLLLPRGLLVLDDGRAPDRRP